MSTLETKTNEINKENKRGGARTGAGRKKGIRTEEQTFTARAKDIKLLHQIKQKTGESLRDIFARLVQEEYKKLSKA
jgi:hypothetical protein